MCATEMFVVFLPLKQPKRNEIWRKSGERRKMAEIYAPSSRAINFMDDFPLYTRTCPREIES